MQAVPSPVDADAVAAFLRERHADDGPVRDIEPLSGGYWSSAFAYRVGGRELVLRVGEVREGFEMDRAAMAFGSPQLPVPEVLEIGEALGKAYAISVRHHGRFLESAGPNDADAVGPTLVALLRALLAVAATDDAGVDWFRGPPPAGGGWRDAVTDGLVDDPSQIVGGWRPKLAGNVEADRLFRACEARIGQLVEACPERRDLIHGDLLHGNVLVSEDFAAVNAVFSWKCSMRGDFAYDLALCTFWAPWHHGIGAARPFERLIGSLAADPSVGERGPGEPLLDDIAVRHHCYELQIGAHHLGWYAHTGDGENQARLIAHLGMVLERGPLPTPRPTPPPAGPSVSSPPAVA